MESIMTSTNRAKALNIIRSKEFLKTPSWATFFYYVQERETLMDFYDFLLDEGFISLEQPHEVTSTNFNAKLMDHKGRLIVLRSE
ncbi:MAG: hypothetical protein LKJ88_08385 [Bacilli bacterium]|jgi:hypothetical protein|nr:hypothetical protein [Bacilli bacterium]